jgi:hypothetical protein
MHCNKRRAWISMLSLDHFVRDGEQTRRENDAECLGDVEVDHEIEPDPDGKSDALGIEQRGIAADHTGRSDSVADFLVLTALWCRRITPATQSVSNSSTSKPDQFKASGHSASRRH